MTAFLLQLCVLSSCSNTLLRGHRHKYLIGADHHRAIVARRTNHAHSASSAAGRRRHYRQAYGLATHSLKRRRVSDVFSSVNANANADENANANANGYPSQPPSKRLLTLARMESSQHIRRRSSAAARSSVDNAAHGRSHSQSQKQTVPEDQQSQSTEAPRSCRFSNHAAEMQLEGKTPDGQADADAMPPPPPPEDYVLGRSSRSTSNASRNTQRLSLTLPIAPPTSDPSRPPSTIMSSFPATPVDSATAAPADANDFIIAIAAQERKVLELREDLAHAEGDLVKLKKQWSAKEAYMKRTAARSAEATRPLGPQLDGMAGVMAGGEDGANARRSIDLDRRRMLLQNQATTPKESRRRVMRGGHTRTLSLLSPTKTDGALPDLDQLRTPDLGPATPAPSSSSNAAAAAAPLSSRPPIHPAAINKRASWQPRSYNPNQQGVKQIAEDFKSGLWSFVEDIRQATVGDEPITGQPNQDGASGRSTPVERPVRRQRPMSIAGDQDTIRASATRGRTPLRAAALDASIAAAATEEAASATTPTPSQGRAAAKPKTRAKHFSWQPLTFDSFDDSDWTNWASPSASAASASAATPSKSARWSGSTVGGGDGIASIPERSDEQETPLKKRSTQNNDLAIDTTATDGNDDPEQSGLSSPRLEELLPNVVNRLTPSNIKRTANNLMDEWERSLSPPHKERSGRLVEAKENQIS